MSVPDGDRLAAFESNRPRLESLAYRMLGTLADAEDAVQETYLRWHKAESVRDPEAWLVSAATRICIDKLRRSRTEREAYAGPWLPEPVVAPLDPADLTQRHEVITVAFMVVLERLSPEERAAWLLHEAFGYSHPEISGIVGKTAAATRQLVSRARRHLARAKPRFPVDPAHAFKVAERFLQLVTEANPLSLEAAVAPDAELWSDGGGRVPSAMNVLVGPVRIARFLIGVAGKQPAGSMVEPCWVGGLPGLVLRAEGQVYATIAIQVDGDLVRGVYITNNPAKLARLNLPPPDRSPRPSRRFGNSG